jgi:hypothetical protein
MQRGYVVKSNLEDYKGFFVVCKDNFEARDVTVPVVVYNQEPIDYLVSQLKELSGKLNTEAAEDLHNTVEWAVDMLEGRDDG